MLKLVPGTLNSIHNEVERSKFANSHFCDTVLQHSSLANSHSPSRRQGVVIGCCTSGKSWSRLLDFFIEHGTVEILEERIEHCMPAWWAIRATKTIFHCTLAVVF